MPEQAPKLSEITTRQEAVKRVAEVAAEFGTK
jgi:hypothetical protein